MKCRPVIPGFTDRALGCKERKKMYYKKYEPENPGNDELSCFKVSRNCSKHIPCISWLTLSYASVTNNP